MEIYHYYTMEVGKVQEETILRHNSTFFNFNRRCVTKRYAPETTDTASNPDTKGGVPRTRVHLLFFPTRSDEVPEGTRIARCK